MPFDIPAQPAGPALNEFARQADIALIFPYDLVANDRTRALQGRYTVDRGLAVLLDGTRLGYRRAVDGTYLICLRTACPGGFGRRMQAPSTTPEADANRNSGNSSETRLHR